MKRSTVGSFGASSSSNGNRSLSTKITRSAAWLMMYSRSPWLSRMLSVCRTAPIRRDGVVHLEMTVAVPQKTADTIADTDAVGPPARGPEHASGDAGRRRSADAYRQRYALRSLHPATTTGPRSRRRGRRSGVRCMVMMYECLLEGRPLSANRPVGVCLTPESPSNTGPGRVSDHPECLFQDPAASVMPPRQSPRPPPSPRPAGAARTTVAPAGTPYRRYPERPVETVATRNRLQSPASDSRRIAPRRRPWPDRRQRSRRCKSLPRPTPAPDIYRPALRPSSTRDANRCAHAASVPGSAARWRKEPRRRCSTRGLRVA